jgi:hypothetical protein
VGSESSVIFVAFLVDDILSEVTALMSNASCW